MKFTLKLLLWMVFVLSGVGGLAQNLSNKGKEFWVGYGHHQFMEYSLIPDPIIPPNSQEMVIYLSAEQEANVTVSVYGTSWVKNYKVPAGTVMTTDFIPKTAPIDARFYTMPPSYGGTGGEGVFSNKAVHIVSDVPIVAYAHIYGHQSSGATMLMPVETWGYAYTSVNSKQQFAENCYSWMYVIAQEDNTVVEITPSAPTRFGKPAGVPFTTTLMKGDAYQVIGANINSRVGYELTGTRIRSIANASGKCYPVAVFSGSSRTSNPASCGDGGGDNDNQQLFPTQAWGKRYLTAPTSSSYRATLFSTNTFKVVAKDPNTVVKLNGSPVATLNPGQYHIFESNQPNYIEADKPIMVGQFLTGGSCLGTLGGFQVSIGDPEMFFISPLEQGIKRTGFFRNNRESIQINYLTLIIPDSGVNSLKIDGVLGNYNSKMAHPQLPGYSIVIKSWSAAQAQAWVESDSAFTAVTYGLGSFESYAYNAGTMINNLNAIGAIHNELDTTTLEHAYTCANTPVQLGVKLAYQPTKLVWQLSKLGNAISPNSDVVQTNPKAIDTIKVKGNDYFRFQLPQSYQFKDSGEYEVTVVSTNPTLDRCDQSEDIKFTVKVHNKPKAQFSFTHSGCIADSVYFSASSSAANGFDINKWNWTFPDGTTSNLQNPVTKLPAAGNNSILFKAISAEGCVGDTTISVATNARPTAAFDASALSLCEGGSVVVTDKSTISGGAPINSWYWDLGNGTSVTTTNNTPQTITYPTYKEYTVRHAVASSNTCVSDTISTPITVYANPKPDFTYPAGCLPVDGVVKFTSATTVPDGQAIASYLWNFDDPNVTANLNSSTLANPTHTYSSGTYNIGYRATTVNGCKKDIVVKAIFNLKPDLTFVTLAPVCESVSGTVSVAKAAVSNGIPGSGVYKGPGTDAAGNFSPSIAKAGTHTLWFVYTTTAGCTDSVSQTIVVYPKPQASFTVTPDICSGGVATLTDKSTLSAGSMVKWNWNLGDGTPDVSSANNNSFSKSYTTDKVYTVKLVAFSDKGCVSDTAVQTITVHPIPKADFTLPAGVCMPNGAMQLTNASSVPDNSTLNYQWSFGDGSAPNTSANPSHTYAVAGRYTIQLKATSAYGCSKDTAKVFSAFYDKPVASFKVAPEILCQGTENVFTDQSTAPNSTLKAWNWTFADGTSASVQHPKKKYERAGNYDVTLKVVNTIGCESEPFTKRVVVLVQPVVDAGPSFVVPQGTRVTFNPKVNDSISVTFRWTPPAGLSNSKILRPSLIANANQTYTLYANDGNCEANDFLTVKILLPVKVPNAFSPNGDGVNDRWEITNLADYPGATVEVYNRYGQAVYRSSGYAQPWDGKVNGKVLSFGTYYYVIILKNGFQPITGSVTILQ